MLRTLLITTVCGLATLVISLTAYAFTSLSSETETTKTNQGIMRERVSKTEAQVEGMDKRLDRIEHKLDLVIEHVNNEHRRTNRRTP